MVALRCLARLARRIHPPDPVSCQNPTSIATHALSTSASKSAAPPPPPRAGDGAGAEEQAREREAWEDAPLLCDAKRKEVVDAIVRVDHAGEVGAGMIYAGQLAVLGGTGAGAVIARMAEQRSGIR